MKSWCILLLLLMSIAIALASTIINKVYSVSNIPICELKKKFNKFHLSSHMNLHSSFFLVFLTVQKNQAVIIKIKSHATNMLPKNVSVLITITVIRHVYTIQVIKNHTIKSVATVLRGRRRCV